jgi:Zn finger protein HypA/HybF involved in hydrogenase expression
MGIGTELPADQEILKANPKLSYTANGYSYVIERHGGVSTYTVSGPAGAVSVPIWYAFGVRMQTYVLETGGKLYESLVSYYPPIGGLANTMGSERIQPKTPLEALGRPVGMEEVEACFGCHSTGAVAGGRLELSARRPGLECEHCHEGAAAHEAAMNGGPAAAMPKKLGELKAEDTSEFCGQCHRTWATVLRMRVFGPLNVRFQPYRLANSKCFLGDDKRIACTACHDPHEDPVRKTAAYDSKCLACHGTMGTQFRKCPVGTRDCASCHMPKVELPGGM